MNMFSRKYILFHAVLVTIVLGQSPVHALPKAAEHEDAPVVISPDVAKPKVSTQLTKKEVQKKTLPPATKKPHKPVAEPKKTKKPGVKK